MYKNIPLLLALAAAAPAWAQHPSHAHGSETKELRVRLVQVGKDAPVLDIVEEGELEDKWELGVQSQRGYLGIYLGGDGQQVSVRKVAEGSGAAAAGMQAGDVIHSVGKQKVSSNTELLKALAGYAAGDSVGIHATRGEDQVLFMVALGERPEQSKPGRRIARMLPDSPDGPFEVKNLEDLEELNGMIDVRELDLSEIEFDEITDEQLHEYLGSLGEHHGPGEHEGHGGHGDHEGFTWFLGGGEEGESGPHRIGLSRQSESKQCPKGSSDCGEGSKEDCEVRIFGVRGDGQGFSMLADGHGGAHSGGHSAHESHGKKSNRGHKSHGHGNRQPHKPFGLRGHKGHPAKAAIGRWMRAGRGPQGLHGLHAGHGQEKGHGAHGRRGPSQEPMIEAMQELRKEMRAMRKEMKKLRKEVKQLRKSKSNKGKKSKHAKKKRGKLGSFWSGDQIHTKKVIVTVDEDGERTVEVIED